MYAILHISWICLKVLNTTEENTIAIEIKLENG